VGLTTGFVSSIEQTIRDAGFNHFGMAPLEKPISMDIYRAWLEAGHHADMEYLSDHADIKENPQKLAPRARSALVIAKSYGQHPYPLNTFPKALRTALYAKGEDYHIHFRNELERTADVLRTQFPNEEFLCFTDSAPILERDLAYRAGLGWFGKNTCLINTEHGSLFFLGQILTSLKVEAREPVSDHCGTCDRCIQACPTQALTPKKLDANKCISFWTIESKGDAPAELRTKFGDWFFGCDICQTVCPWNEKVFGRETMQTLVSSPEESPAELVEDLRWVLRSSNREIQRQLKDSAVSRARPYGLKRNALVVIANKRLTDLRVDVEALSNQDRFKDLATWCLSQLN
jgi:epoxyqueuosine reductase